MSLPRVELGKLTSLMIGDLTLRASLDRHHLLGIEPVVDPISPNAASALCASRSARAVRRPCRISVARRGSRRPSDLLWVGAAPSFLRAICSILSFGIAKFGAIVKFTDANKNTNKLDG
jgi:hypothetical protein